MTRRVTARSRAGSPVGVLARTRVGAAALACAALVAGLGVPAEASSAPGVPGAELVVTGTVERVHIDDFGSANGAAGEEQELTFVNTSDGAVQVPTSALERVPDGAVVRVGLADSRTADVSAAGVRVRPEQAAAAGQDAEAGADVTGLSVVAEQGASLVDTGTSASAEPAVAPATHSVLAVVVTPSNGSDSSVSAADVAATINGKVDAYWREVTGGAVSFTATAYPSVVRTSTTPCINGSLATSFDFWDEVKARTGFTEGPGKHLVVYFRTLSGCNGVAGLGTVGSGHTSGGLVWTNGYNTTGVIGHELGHNLSLGHSQTLDCTVNGVRAVDGTASQCTKRSYTDTNDIMAVSWQNQGFLNASHLRYLGLLGDDEVAPTDNGTVTLAPLASGSGTRALTLYDGANRYVVEYRAAVGQDAWMSSMPGWGSVGVTVRKDFDPAASSSFTARESLLLDGRPGTPDSSFGELDAALPEGVWVDLADGRLGLRVVSADDTGAVVEYRNGEASSDTRYVAPPAPTLTAPAAGLRTGSITRTSAGPVVPMRWRWTWTSEDGLSTQDRSATGTAKSTKPGNRWTYRATALASDGSTVVALGSATGIYRTDTPSPKLTYTSAFKKAYSSTALGSYVHRSYWKGSKVKVTVTSSSVGLLLQRGPRNGRVDIYVDGVKVDSLWMRSSTRSTRLAWVANWGAEGTHTITLVNATGGTYGRMGFDGYVRL